MGAISTPILGTAIGTAVGIVNALLNPVTAVPGSSGPWRPPQWNSPSTTTPPLTLTAVGSNGQQTAYVFDAIIRAEHTQKLVCTQNPVQTGAAITDNAFLVPPTLVAEIRMSDAMQSFTVGQFSGASSRSVSAYQTLINLQATLTPVQVATRLRQYDSMMIVDVYAPDDKDFKYGLKMIVTFQKIITATVSQTTANSGTGTGGGNSAIPQSSALNATGQVQTQPVPSSIQSQNNIANSPPVP